MEIIHNIKRLSMVVDSLHKQGKTIGLVPTMGALHAGHMSLIFRALQENDAVIVSVFVNPTQFNNPNDLASYPRTEQKDCDMLSDAGVQYAFLPSVQEIYPEPDTRVFDLGPVAEVMEGKMRPGHFNGVCQIVSKLFDMTKADRAYFGEKDFQQIAVIKRMVELLGTKIEIVECPIQRYADGLALSSRNVRLTPEQRAVAPAIHRILAESLVYADSHSLDETIRFVVDSINEHPEMEVEYYQIVDTLTMQPLQSWDDMRENGAVGCVTVYCGDVRLIDNIRYPKKH